MKNLNQEIFSYVDSKSGSWAQSTIHTAYAKLCTISELGFEPESLYKKLKTAGYSPYTIKTYFILAASYQKTKFNNQKIQTWMQSNRLYFKNSYKEKTKQITKSEYEKFLKESKSDSFYNFLILTGRFGLRKTEVFNVKWEDFSHSGLWVNGKGNKQRFIPLSISILKNVKQQGFIIPSDLKYQDFIKPFTAHDLRSYAITSWGKQNNLSIKEAQIVAGHESILTTSRYIRTDLTEIGEKLK